MDENFKKRIQTLVDKVGGQSALARATNMSLGAIQRYLKGGDPTRAALIRLAKAGDVSMSWLIFGEEGKMKISSEGKRKMRLYGFSETSKKGWQEPFSYRVKTDLEWPDSELFAVIAGDDFLEHEGIRADYTCFVSPNTRPQPDDIVYIKNTSGEAGFKKYLKEDKSYIYVEGYKKPKKKGEMNPFGEAISREQLEQMAPVVFVKRR